MFGRQFQVVGALQQKVVENSESIRLYRQPIQPKLLLCCSGRLAVDLLLIVTSVRLYKKKTVPARATATLLLECHINSTIATVL